MAPRMNLSIHLTNMSMATQVQTQQPLLRTHNLQTSLPDSPPPCPTPSRPSNPSSSGTSLLRHSPAGTRPYSPCPPPTPTHPTTQSGPLSFPPPHLLASSQPKPAPPTLLLVTRTAEVKQTKCDRPPRPSSRPQPPRKPSSFSNAPPPTSLPRSSAPTKLKPLATKAAI